jgi:hypothetical protein
MKNILLYLKETLIIFMLFGIMITIVIGLGSFILWENLFPEFINDLFNLRILLLLSFVIGIVWRMLED